MFFMLNVYSHNYQITLKYLKNTKANFHNMFIMAGNFSIRDNIWDPSYPFHLIYNNFLFDITDSLNLKLSILIQQIPTQYLDNANNANSVVNLFFSILTLWKLIITALI